MNSFRLGDLDEIIFLCWMENEQSRRELVRVVIPKTPVGEARLDSKKYNGCASIDKSLKSNEPIFLDAIQSDADLSALEAYLKTQGFEKNAASVRSVWETAEKVEVKGNAQPIVTGGGITSGPIHQRCLISWDDSHQIHSQKWIVRWDYQAVKTRMKKLRHCIRLTVTGPIDAKDVAKDYVAHCVDRALNDDKTRHIVQGIIGLGLDVLSAGATGGSATAAAIADYLKAAKEKLIGCLTDEKQIQAYLAQSLAERVGAVVENESHWEYWDL
ncbi:hypothetical protein IC232_03955 [Microvirga sp. BT688]|uniref:hypothetical protein n=1 Tax=Microvirga sp. TaxID=1873136 RepID=UPI00168460D4|nr:hypothetical protein [Microvirga sp.]MBD2745846.1 hypothetical protein [Microvirga sp.]